MNIEKAVLALLFVFAMTQPARAVDGSGLIGHWRFDEGGGTTAYDSVGDNDGTIYGAQWTTGQVGDALYFDGDGDYVALGDPASLNFSGLITIVAWIKPDVIKGVDINRNIVAHGYGGYPTKAVYLRIANDGQYEIGSYIKSSTSTGRAEYVIPPEDKDNWVHLAGLYDGLAWRLYRNGIQVASKNRPLGAVEVYANWAIGARGTGTERFFTGTVDEVMIFNRDLSAEEVWQLYESGLPTIVDVDIKPGSCPNPLNLASKGLLPVAILGSADFDVESLDRASIRLEGAAPLRSHMEDVATPVTDGNLCDCNAAGPDGYTDLMLKFKTQQVAAQIIGWLDEPAAGDELVLTLTGALSDGTLIEAEECVLLVGNVPRALAAMKSDITDDGVVNIRDFAVLAEYWLELATIDY